ncbi:AtmB protein [Penicillium frequentans]|nr:AtmB protein [Penicillium glabrum]
MDYVDPSKAPLEYQKYEWIANLSGLACGSLWSIHYFLQARQSLREKTYSQAIFPFCANTAWEFVYTFIYPPKRWATRVSICSWFFMGLTVMYSAVKTSPREWNHAPLVQRHLPLIFFLAFLYFVTWNLAIVGTWGQPMAGVWTGIFCQNLLLLGSLSQLVVRQDSRGLSYSIWLTRFLGAIVMIPGHLVRYWYWPAEFSWSNCPAIIWESTFIILCELTYGALLWYFRQQKTQNMKKAA